MARIIVLSFFYICFQISRFSLRSAAGSAFSSSSFLIFPNCSFYRKSTTIYTNYLRFHFFDSQPPKPLHSRIRDYLYELYRSSCRVKPHSSVCFLFIYCEFLGASFSIFSFTATAREKVAYPMLKHLLCSVMDRLFHIFNLSWSLHFFSYNLKDTFYYSRQ